MSQWGEDSYALMSDTKEALAQAALEELLVCGKKRRERQREKRMQSGSAFTTPFNQQPVLESNSQLAIAREEFVQAS